MIGLGDLHDLEITRQQIVEEMASVDRELSHTLRSDYRRRALIDKKSLLLRQLREQKLRIAEAKKKLADPELLVAQDRVSDHALVRWLERRHGIDVERLKNVLLTDQLRSAMATEQRFWSDGDLVYVLKERTVVTVIPVAELPGGAA